jgi:creatinine amidohydrolase/Fe(II)-dependent formamide hydrolase-like protein
VAALEFDRMTWPDVKAAQQAGRCSDHHLEFAGTLSISEPTFSGTVADLVRSAARSGCRRLVLLPTHGGNFAPLAAALEQLGRTRGLRSRLTRSTPVTGSPDRA